MTARRLRPLEERFWSKVEKSASCWLFAGPLKGNGYGVIGHGRKGEGYHYAHRLAWELANGPIPDGKAVCHHCDVRNCVRPDHLFLGTQADNLADMRAKGRQASPDQTKHLGEANGRSVLTVDKVRTIRARLAAGEPIAWIARDLGVGETTIRNIRDGFRWSHAA